MESRSNKIIDHEKYLSPDAKLRQLPYLITLRMPETRTCPAIDLGGGKPCSSTFPFKEAKFTMHNGEVLQLNQSHMEDALQYGAPRGHAELVTQVTEIVTKLHNPPHMDERGVLITGGANNSNYLIVHTFLEAGDYIIVQECTYPNLLNTARDRKVNIVTIPYDSQGMRADLLREALNKLPTARRKLLYFVTSGDNPTGVTMPESRRRELYNVACEYDILLFEDDPYYILQYGPQRPPTFLSLDTDGRVLRIDSFAKTLGAGLRVGYITADKPFIERLQVITAFTITHANTLSQVLLSTLFRHWGVEGFLKFTNDVKEQYKKKRDNMLQAANKHLTGLCEWTESDGMFLWMKVLGVEDTKHIVERECWEKGVVLVPGSAFMKDHSMPSPYIRASISLTTPEELDIAFRILAEIIRNHLEKTKKKPQAKALNPGHKAVTNRHTHDPKHGMNGVASGTKEIK